MNDFIKNTLTNLCLVRDEHNSTIGDDKYSNRLVFIINILKENNIEYYIDTYSIHKEVYHNLIVPFVNDNHDTSLILTSHYDVVNIESDNCLDNSGSIVNLLYIILNLNKIKSELNRNIFCIFSSGEEVGGIGAQQISSQIINKEFKNVLGVINLELTSFGDTIIIEDYKRSFDIFINNRLRFEHKCVKEQMPFSESLIYVLHDIQSCTLSLGYTINDKIELSHWRLCHSNKDRIDLANFEDMENFCNKILTLVILFS